MKTYSVADAAEMLNVNAETVRRWIRSEKLQAVTRAVGRGGNSICLDEIVRFANRAPENYLLPLARWLDSRGIPFDVVEVRESFEAREKRGGLLGAALGAGMASTVMYAAGMPFAILGSGLAAAFAAYQAAESKRNRDKVSYILRLKEQDEYEVITVPESPAVERADTVELLPAPAAPEHRTVQDAGTDVRFAEPEENGAEPEADAADAATDGTHDHGRAADALQDIAFAKKLLDDGVITQDEFSAIKSKLIARL